MENIIITIENSKVKEAFEEAAKELFKSSYNNPVKDLLEKSVKEKEGEIKKIVDEIVIEAIGNPEFKSKIADAVINSLVQSALKRN